MRTRGRQISVLCILFVGAVLFAYGLFFHSTAISSGQDEDSAVYVQSEPALIREVSVGGLRRDESGQVQKTYTGQPPSACPT
ncbi:MAG TPA: hypothetical protein VMW16_05260 [Sedimentisphaerales bacterium]|nr:hypothetical protein [Sedimentisphaerales bacterium]